MSERPHHNSSTIASLPLWAVAIAIGLVITAGCGSDTVTTPTSTSSTPTTEVYTGTLSAGGSGFYAFTAQAAGSANITFGSLTDASGRPMSSPLTLGFGVPDGVGCAVTASVTAAPGLSAQLISAVSASTYCVQLADSGALTGASTFGVRIVHP